MREPPLPLERSENFVARVGFQSLGFEWPCERCAQTFGERIPAFAREPQRRCLTLDFIPLAQRAISFNAACACREHLGENGRTLHLGLGRLATKLAVQRASAEAAQGYSCGYAVIAYLLLGFFEPEQGHLDSGSWQECLRRYSGLSRLRRSPPDTVRCWFQVDLP